MCKAFSCIVDQSAKVYWKFGMDSHTDILKLTPFKDQTADPSLMEFARVEITPKNKSYLKPDLWVYRIDENIKPIWAGRRHEEACHVAHTKWLAKLHKILISKEVIHPFDIPAPAITKQHIALLKKWDSVGDSVRASVWASVRASVGDSVGDSVWDSVRDSVGDSVRASVWASVRASVGDSVWAYTGSFFNIPKWKYVEHAKGKYPYASLVKLWEQGLVPSFDGTTWRLHGGNKAAILFSITADELRK